METLLGLCIGIGLSAACGFRVFVPLWLLSIAALCGWLTPMQQFAWVAHPMVCFALAVATLLEIGAYYIPWVDNALDTIATPAAMLAGTLSTLVVSSGEMSQFSHWAVALIAGGGTAGLVQMGSVALRATSTATTAGIANPFIATVEWLAALMVSLLSLWLPIITLIVVIILLGYILSKLHLRYKTQPPL